MRPIDEIPLHAGLIAMLAEAIVIILFIGMVLVWSAIGAGA